MTFRKPDMVYFSSPDEWRDLAALFQLHLKDPAKDSDSAHALVFKVPLNVIGSQREKLIIQKLNMAFEVISDHR